MATSKNLFIFGVLCLCYLSTASATERNCTAYIKVKSTGRLNYLAEVNFPAPKSVQGPWSAEMQMDIPFTFLGGWGIWLNVDAEDGTARIRSKDDGNVTMGDPISFRFRISWHLDDAKPTVILFKWEDTVICQPTIGTADSIRSVKRRRYDEMRNRNPRRRLRVN